MDHDEAAQDRQARELAFLRALLEPNRKRIDELRQKATRSVYASRWAQTIGAMLPGPWAGEASVAPILDAAEYCLDAIR